MVFGLDPPTTALGQAPEGTQDHRAGSLHRPWPVPRLSDAAVSQVNAYTSEVASEAREEYLRVLGAMCRKLKAAQYHGSYFDRGAEAGSRLCTPEGWFSCQVSGRFPPAPRRPAGLRQEGLSALGLGETGE